MIRTTQHTRKKKSKIPAVVALSVTGAVLLASIGVNAYQWMESGKLRDGLAEQKQQVQTLDEEKSTLQEEKSTLEKEKEELSGQLDQLKEDSVNVLGKNDADFPYSALYPDLYVDSVVAKAEETKTAYLSFDDGPSKVTSGILDTLNAAGVKATFFVTAQSIDSFGDVLQRAAAEGHCIGIHSYTHNYQQIYASVPAYLDDFNQMFEKVVELTGQKPRVFRFPGGSINNYNRSIYQSIIAEMTRRGFTYYDWNVESGDASAHAPTPEQMVERINGSLEYQSPVVLMHDAAPKTYTAEALPQIIEAYKNAGFAFGTLDNRASCFFPYRVDLEE